jgi:hypothetical protein
LKKKLIVGIGSAVILVSAFIGARIYASNIAEEKIDMAIENIANHATVDYGNINVDLLKQDINISDVVISSINSKAKIIINEIVIHDIDEKSDIPLFMNVSFNGVNLSESQLIDNNEIIKKLGNNGSSLMDISVDYLYNQEDQVINLNKLNFSADNVGEMDVSFRLGNIDLNPQKNMYLFSVLPKIILHNVKVAYRDESLIEVLQALAAKDQNKSIEAIKTEAINDINQIIKREKDDFTKTALNEIKNFINNPESLTISLTPTKPLALGKLMHVSEPKDLIRLLNVEVKS